MLFCRPCTGTPPTLGNHDEHQPSRAANRPVRQTNPRLRKTRLAAPSRPHRRRLPRLRRQRFAAAALHPPRARCGFFACPNRATARPARQPRPPQPRCQSPHRAAHCRIGAENPIAASHAGHTANMARAMCRQRTVRMLHFRGLGTTVTHVQAAWFQVKSPTCTAIAKSSLHPVFILKYHPLETLC